MIKVNELRIGNFVKDKNGKIGKVLSIESLNSDTAEYVEAEPILLTPEILEKCGFEKVPFGYIKDEFQITLHNNYSYHSKNMNAISIVSLHQLQNLYFALTDKELEIEIE